MVVVGPGKRQRGLWLLRDLSNRHKAAAATVLKNATISGDIGNSVNNNVRKTSIATWHKLTDSTEYTNKAIRNKNLKLRIGEIQ